MQNHPWNLFKSLVVIAVCVSITACSWFSGSRPYNPYTGPNFFLPPKQNFDVTGIGLNDSNAVYLNSICENVRVLQIGNNYTIYIPSDTFFLPQSGFILKTNYWILNKIAKVLRRYNNVPITVTGYTDDVGSVSQNIWLANQQAQNIVTYLWMRGVNNLMIQPVAMGEKYPIATNTSLRGSRYNRHIEITFRCN